MYIYCFILLFYTLSFYMKLATLQERKSGMASIKVSRLHLVDLAGSERQKDTHAEGLRLKVNFTPLSCN